MNNLEILLTDELTFTVAVNKDIRVKPSEAGDTTVHLSQLLLETVLKELSKSDTQVPCGGYRLNLMATLQTTEGPKDEAMVLKFPKGPANDEQAEEEAA